jgi:hypothetical protein
MGQDWEKAALERGWSLAPENVPEPVKATLAEIALEGAKAAMETQEALDALEVMGLIQQALVPVEYERGDILKAVVSVLPEPVKKAA